MAVVFAQPIENYPAYLALSTVPTMTNSDSAYPASKLLLYDPTATARTTAGSTVITWDYGIQREFDVVSLLYSNASYAATIQVEYSTDGAIWTVAQSTRPFWAHRTSVPSSWNGEFNDPRRGALQRNCSWFYSPTVLTGRYLRLTVADPNTANLTFGRLFVGRSFSPSTGVQYGTSFSFNDSGRAERTDGGALVMEGGTSVVSATLKMDYLTSAEMYDYAYEFDYWLGSCRELIACLDTEDVPRLQKNTLYARLSEGRTINAEAFNSYSKAWVLESLA